MKLSRQLLLVSLLVLILPVAGINWVRDMALTLREQQAQVLNASLRATAASLALRGSVPDVISPKGSSEGPPEGVVYVHPTRSGLIPDGYFEDWKAQNLSSRSYGRAGEDQGDKPPVTFNAASDGSNLYLAFLVKSDGVVYYSPVGKTLANGDRVQLFLKDEKGLTREYIIVTEAPGPVVAKTETVWNGTSRIVRENRIRGAWREIPGGYQLELMMPLSMTGKYLGFLVINGKDESRVGSMAPGAEPGTLVLPDWQLAETLEYFLEPEMRLGVVNSIGWQIADTGPASRSDAQKNEQPVWLVEWLFRTILRWDSLPDYSAHWRDGNWQGSFVTKALDGHPQYLWLRGNETYRLLAALPLLNNDDGIGEQLVKEQLAGGQMVGEQVLGALIAEQGSQALLSITWRSFNRLFSLSFFVMALAVTGLLGYASWLSLRIRKLNRATERCIIRDGRLRTLFPVSKARDEVGELSRSINTMLLRLEEHTEYLRTLGSKLSHELRTPLAVVRSSLDNLEHEDIHPQARVYSERAMAGADRLSSLLSSISEATRLESMIDDMASVEREEVDFRQMLEDLYHAYSGVYPGKLFILELPKESCTAAIIPDMIVQALDKLISNAVDFCSPQGKIIIRLVSTIDNYMIEVENDGQLLPEAMQESLFNSMVSVRKKKSDKAHLGLGLYIVRLVMACHSGAAIARNRDDHSGVVFRLLFQK